MTYKTSEMISPSFYEVHKEIKSKTQKYKHFTLKGGRGSTKSSFVSIEVILLILKNKEYNALVLRKIAKDLRDSVYRQYEWAINTMGLRDFFNFKISPMEIVYKKTGQKILFRGADKPEKIKSIKVSKGYIAITHFEELDQFNGREEVRNILQSTMRGGDIAYNFETFNPPISRHNWANLDILEERENRLITHTTYKDVPVKWLGKAFIDEAEHLKLTNNRAYRHEYLGEVIGVGGNVFENIEVREISGKEIENFEYIFQGLDFGYFPDPCAFIKCSYKAKEKELYIFYECVRKKKTNSQMLEILEKEKVFDKDRLIIADSASPKDVSDYKAYGCYIKGASKPKNGLEYSLKWLSGLNKIVIDKKRCPVSTKEFTRYEYDKTKDGEYISNYPDKDNHTIDAVRYALNNVWSARGY